MPVIVPRSASELELLVRDRGTPAARRQRLAVLQARTTAAEAVLELPPPSRETVIVWETLLGRHGVFATEASRPTATAWAAAEAAGTVGSMSVLPPPYSTTAVARHLPAFQAAAKPAHLRVDYGARRP
ncbi:MAG: hypothetical protein ACK537_02230 [Pseudomonadota bacterium]